MQNCHAKGPFLEAKCPQLRNIWISCEGETAADKENAGKISYVEKPAFPGYYFPYLRQMNYQR